MVKGALPPEGSGGSSSSDVLRLRVKFTDDLRCCMSEDSFVSYFAAEIGAGLSIDANRVGTVNMTRPHERYGLGWVTFDIRDADDAEATQLTATITEKVAQILHLQGFYLSFVTSQIDPRPGVERIFGVTADSFVPLHVAPTLHSPAAAQSEPPELASRRLFQTGSVTWYKPTPMPLEDGKMPVPIPEQITRTLEVTPIAWPGSAREAAEREQQQQRQQALEQLEQQQQQGRQAATAAEWWNGVIVDFLQPVAQTMQALSSDAQPAVIAGGDAARAPVTPTTVFVAWCMAMPFAILLGCLIGRTCRCLRRGRRRDGKRRKAAPMLPPKGAPAAHLSSSSCRLPAELLDCEAGASSLPGSPRRSGSETETETETGSSAASASSPVGAPPSLPLSGASTGADDSSPSVTAPTGAGMSGHSWPPLQTCDEHRSDQERGALSHRTAARAVQHADQRSRSSLEK